MNINFEALNIYVIKSPVDFRKGPESLVAIVNDTCEADPYDHSLYIFTNRAKNKLKCVLYDGTGLWMFYKKLNSGHFNWTMQQSGLVSLRQEQLEWLLSGLCIDTGKVFSEFQPLYV